MVAKIDSAYETTANTDELQALDQYFIELGQAEATDLAALDQVFIECGDADTLSLRDYLKEVEKLEKTDRPDDQAA